ncbi:NAD(P)-dependent oxidoreductase [Dactylosporangium vinaceum]|uniref:NAD-dependent epimerase/dehydratase family protein n=1 Tax=Dactylosporangium vinaceum TaxID=53362 RepID=A0ABV5MDZ5_9ACTN|nr:NAD(P)-dependent oxidoreductase [Dactylosporangium vinaceum]UAC01010.1 NAD(P)-dependent oxidoreductase [Dactylosporangium vinaceum]
MRVLVTGANGNIGRAVCARLAAEQASIAALVLAEPAPPPASAWVIGDAGDPDTVRRALGDGVDAVVHLAAIPAPTLGTPIDVFAGNTRATFNVLEECARAGVRRAVIASSYSILGLPFAPRVLHPAYYPIDESTPLQIEDPYSLSKQVDEATAAMMQRRYGLDIVALRFPFTAGADRIAATAAATREDPSRMAADSWSYLHVDDAAAAVWLALTRPVTGVHPLLLAAPTTLADRSTMDLIAEYHPSTVLNRPIPGRDTPIDTGAIERLLGFRAGWTL